MAVEGGTVLVVAGTDTGAEPARKLADTGAFDVIGVDSIPAALSALDANPIDCIVSGHEVADEHGIHFHGGLALLRTVQNRNSSVPFVFYSDVDNEEMVRTAVTAGASDVVTWSDDASMDQLHSRVKHAVARRRAERRADRQQRINRVIRDVNQALVRADSRQEVELAACRTLTTTDTYHLAALGRYADGQFQVRSAVPGTFPDEGVPPVDALAGEVRVTREGTWVDHLTDAAVATVPVSFTGGHFGHLLIGADRYDAFDATEREMLAELGETLAHAIDAARARSELERKNERLEHFASVLSHDLRNPLQVAFGRVDLLADEHESHHVNRIEASLARMQELVDNILALIHHEESPLEPATIDLATVALESWNSVETTGARLDVDDDLGRVAADRSQLRQLFENLFRNAVEHGSTSPDSHARQDAVEHGSTSPDPHARRDAVEDDSTSPRSPEAPEDDENTEDERAPVTVRIRAIDGGFAVCDDGLGIPEREREHVFELDYSTAPAGTGLGLAIVEEIAADHGWEVTVSESEDGGARFEIRT